MKSVDGGKKLTFKDEKIKVWRESDPCPEKQFSFASIISLATFSFFAVNLIIFVFLLRGFGGKQKNNEQEKNKLFQIGNEILCSSFSLVHSIILILGKVPEPGLV